MTFKLSSLTATIFLTVAACADTSARKPAPETVAGIAAPYGIKSNDHFIRNWGDELTLNSLGGGTLGDYAERIKATHADQIKRNGFIKLSMLALSGGGPDGAFGAGLLNGWTARGDRPEFSTVTGVSTGAIIALFAFIGPDYDRKLEEVYTQYRTDQLIEATFSSALIGGSAVTNTDGYRGLVEHYVDQDVMQRLRDAANEGRTLLVGTTNLDAARPAIWNITGIAATNHIDAERLVEDVILASSAIPGIFPPVLSPVTSETGVVYDEMHVDGGATQQVMLFSPGYPLSRVESAVGTPIERTLYVVMNNKLRKPYRPVEPRLIPIASAAASSPLGGSGASDIYKIYTIAQRDSIDFNVLALLANFVEDSAEVFDPTYMTSLYELGYEFGFNGEEWSDRPPSYVAG